MFDVIYSLLIDLACCAGALRRWVALIDPDMASKVSLRQLQFELSYEL
jgi:hypothetical protein